MSIRCCILTLTCIAITIGLATDRVLGDAHAAGPSADLALRMLTDGNARYVAQKMTHPNQTADRRAELAKGQHPYAVILACADSRVSPEVIFDAGLGDLFVIRVAGNIADDADLASIEYAVEHLGSTLVVVEGHSNCGAVQATIDAVQTGTAPPGHLGTLVDAIKPAVTSQKPGDGLIDRAVDANVRNVVAKVSADDIVGHLVKDGKAKVVGGRYDLATGEFKLLDSEHAEAKPGDELMHVASGK
jgi:carbonic anhydrase